jgi:hypothetical protein
MTTISELHNPNNIIGFLHVNGNEYKLNNNQGFQEYPRSLELWEKLPDGRLVLLKRWYKKSICFLMFK